ncbi:YchJ family protein [Ectothiorhodospira variabilis]|uniref:YchJ family protein n=1 Tax=Ectothiorhodospira variabilis TaxID=505694 RepID=UPI001EFAFC34|nr:YchJ family protein [Ectothiorhodospira variabilis]MCG5493240.1 YchJ family protein [Ectothiorhodospira variabilis]MCG5502569.1 YchJ family protein [Ectothiorhodospira variabilis]MCG5505665.1 YchJ family protein [Ectothiorhodospira variabilis]
MPKRKHPPRADNAPCPCGAGLHRERCCGPFLDGTSLPPTAEALMRSRYTAFVEGRTDYLLDTWLPRTRPPLLDLEPNQQWLGLSIRATSAGGVGDERGEVEFVARSRIAGRGIRLHERSRFQRVDGRWYYVDGDFPG